MGVLKGDYIGFTYNNIHSSELGIVRTSDGSRFNENLLPTMQDKTVQVPGGDGTYFFGSYYTQRQFSVSFAFDELTEEGVQRIKEVFGDKQIHDLIFDETPYKVYSAKVTGTATIKYIPFSEGETNRLYKGEGTIQFTCYYPFARCWSTEKDDYKKHPAYGRRDDNGEWIEDEEINFESRIAEWWNASRIDDGGNFGDVPVPFELDLSGDDEVKRLMIEGKTVLDWTLLPEGMSGILNTKTGLAENKDPNVEPKDKILNRYVSGDLTYKIPVKSNIANAQFTCLYI